MALELLRGSLVAGSLLALLSASGALGVFSVGLTILAVHPNPPSAGTLLKASLQGAQEGWNGAGLPEAAIGAEAGEKDMPVRKTDEGANNPKNTPISERFREPQASGTVRPQASERWWQGVKGAVSEMLERTNDEYTGILDLQHQQKNAEDEAVGVAYSSAVDERLARLEDAGERRKSSGESSLELTTLQPAQPRAQPSAQPSADQASSRPAQRPGARTPATPQPPPPRPVTRTPPPVVRALPLALPVSVPGQGSRGLLQEREGQLVSQKLLSGWKVQSQLLDAASPSGRVKVAVIRLPQTEEPGTGEAVDRELAWMIRAGAQAVVLDMQGCPGGNVEEAAQVAGLFLGPGKTFAHLKSRLRTEDLLTAQPEFMFSGARRAAQLPLVLVQDGGTASACEMLLGALVDWNRASTLGERSYGKGSTQGTLPLRGPGPGPFALLGWINAQLSTEESANPENNAERADEPRLLIAISQGLWTTPRGRSAGHHAGVFQSAGTGVDTPGSANAASKPGLLPDRIVPGTQVERLRAAVQEAAAQVLRQQ